MKKSDVRGQELSISTLVLLALAVVVLVFIIIGFTQGWGYIFDKMGFLPDDLNSGIAVCEQYASSEALAPSFCQYRELRILGKKGWINCPGIYQAAKKELGDVSKLGFTDTSVSCSLTAKQFYDNNKDDKFGNKKVNIWDNNNNNNGEWQEFSPSN